MKVSLGGGDRVLGQACPKCRRESIVYNGNYWCILCSWVMDRNVPRITNAFLTQCFNEAKEKMDTKTMYTMVFYMMRS